jgi:uncharacterized repeat protein (TIGR03803 family)
MSPKQSAQFLRASILAAIFICLSVNAHSQVETVLHSFANGPGGGYPIGSLTFDPQGNLYGVTQDGGNLHGFCDQGGCGIVFELSPSSNGVWKQTVLHAFTYVDGAFPQAGLVRDAAGNLYGTTVSGGQLCRCGAVYELSPTSTGGWKETVLYSFYNGADGFVPYSQLVLDAAGNLYGTTATGGSTTTACSTIGCGVVFMLSPSSNGGWKEKVLYTFDGTDGAYLYSGVIFDEAGNLYGETYTGLGAGSRGTVFKLSPTSSGPWTLTTLHGFSGNDASYPGGGLVFDKAGNLYGTTQGVSSQGACPPSCGSVFELSPNSDGTWTETILHAFTGSVDGAYPAGRLLLDNSGNLYGTAAIGGAYNSGSIFKLTPSSGGTWNFSVTYSFPGGLYGGFGPQWGVIEDGAGNLYGNALGGQGKYGIVYEITP